MFTKITKGLRIGSSLTSVKFITSTLLTIILSAVFLMLIYAWSTAQILTQQVLNDEGSAVQTAASSIDSFLEQSYTNLKADYISNKPIDPSLGKTFQIGIIQEKAGKTSSINLNDTRLPYLTNYLQNQGTNTAKYYFDSTNNLLYVVYSADDGGYEAGAIDTTTDKSLYSIYSLSGYHAYFVSNSGNILDSNTKNTDINFIKSLNIKYDNFQQVKLGNIHRSIFSYAPLSTVNLGIGMLSDPITGMLMQDSANFLYFLLLLCLILFLAITIIFALLIDIPLTQTLDFLQDYAEGNVRELHIHAQDSFGTLAKHINELIKKVHNDFQRIGQADSIQEDFLLLSGHLLRTPLTSIQGYVDILSSLQPTKQQSEIITNIQTAVTKLKQLEENIIALSADNTKIINAPVDSVNAKEIMEEIFAQMETQAKEKNINFILDTTSSEQIAIKVNRGNIIHALKNLIDNAIKFTSEGGTVKLYAKVKDNSIIFSVSDTGIGMTKDELEKIFIKFSKVSDTLEYNSDGFGIGLYVTKIIVETYNGKVWADSIKGSGSIFNIQLPIGN